MTYHGLPTTVSRIKKMNYHGLRVLNYPPREQLCNRYCINKQQRAVCRGVSYDQITVQLVPADMMVDSSDQIS